MGNKNQLCSIPEQGLAINIVRLVMTRHNSPTDLTQEQYD
jgi:hypothetical protein